ncbi:GTA-gp10 family protein [Salipiger bermudensis]|uniref:GTA-gp10 family protein n=1 Tax=Salipiger bermudensis TaxID=344736 RepID=UPI001A90B6C3|nr:GTA-gp10 family protein [Salipiger bermudensis]MBN9674644.1 hypothetical protein [Salipiger bermudensis]
MISGVTKEIGGASETFRLTSRAMMAIEDTMGAGIVEVMQGLEKGFRVGTVVRLLAECASDGAGRDLGWAQGAVDEIGLEAAGELMGEIAEAAFPQATKGSAGKNAKGAARSK